MNEQHLAPDEAASAFLDDELAETEAEDVRGDPELAARAAALRRAAAAVGEPVTPPPRAEDSAVAAALADFDTRQVTRLGAASRRPRSLPVITAIAAAVAVGFIVAAAVGLFAEGADDRSEAAGGPPVQPALESAFAESADGRSEAAAAPPAAPADAPAPASEPGATAAAPAVPPDPPQADEAAAMEDAPTADDMGDTMADDMGDTMAEAATLPAEPCAAVIGDGTVEKQLTVEQTQVLVIRTPDGRTTALAAATCDEIEPGEAPDDGQCAAVIGDGTVEKQLTVEQTQVLVIRTPDGRTTALAAATCDEIEPPDADGDQ